MDRSIRILTGLGFALILWCAFYTAGMVPPEYRKVIDYSAIIHDASLLAFFKFIIVALPVMILAVFYVPKKREQKVMEAGQVQKLLYFAPLLLFYLYSALSEEWSVGDFVGIAVVVSAYCFFILYFYSSALLRNLAMMFVLLCVVASAGYYSGTVELSHIAGREQGFRFTVQEAVQPQCQHVVLRTDEGLLVHDVDAGGFDFLYHKDITDWGAVCSLGG